MKFLVAFALLLFSVTFAEDLPPPTSSDSSLATPDPLNPQPSLGTPTDGTAKEDPLLAEPTEPTQPTTEPAPQELPTASAPPAATEEGEVLNPVEAAEEENVVDMRMRKNREDAVRDRRLLETELAYHEGGRWHIGLDYAHRPFGDYDYDSTTVNRNSSSAGGEFQLLYFPLTYGFGRLGFGPVVGYSAPKDKSGHFVSYGAELQYAFLYGIGQTLVPFVLGGYRAVSFTSYDIASSAVTKDASFGQGYYGGGLALNLNRLEHRTASRALADIGVRKFYIVATYKVPASNGNKGNGLLGLRFEF